MVRSAIRHKYTQPEKEDWHWWLTPPKFCSPQEWEARLHELMPYLRMHRTMGEQWFCEFGRHESHLRREESRMALAISFTSYDRNIMSFTRGWVSFDRVTVSIGDQFDRPRWAIHRLLTSEQGMAMIAAWPRRPRFSWIEDESLQEAAW